MIFKNRIIQLSGKKNLFLFGIRGSGKTQLLNRLFPSALYIDLLDKSLYQSFLSENGLFYKQVSAFREDGLVIVDEIQRMPDLLDEVHRLIESSHRRFILTGSSARKINAKKVNLLGGRAGKAYLHPFVPEELGEDFSLDEALRYGLIPIVWSDPDRSAKLQDYIETYLEEDIRAEAWVRDLPAFSRFLQTAGLCHGQVVNMSNIARDVGIERHDVRNFFSILEETHLGFFVPAYASQLKIKEKKSPKFYLTDPGLARGVKKNFGPVALEEKGFLFEGLIAQLLRAYKSYRNNFCKEIYYWSPIDKTTEADFILEREDGLTAVEVKAKERVSALDYKSLRAVKKNLPAVINRRILVYMGKMTGKTEDGIEIQPFDFFCKNLKEDFQADPSDKPTRPAPRPFPAPPFLSGPPPSPSKSEKKLEDYKGLNWGKNEDKE